MNEGMKFTIRVENNSQLVISELEKATERALYAIGVKGVEGSVYAISGKLGIERAVKTGRLRASISFITPAGDMTVVPNGEKRFENKEVENSEDGDKLSGTAEKNSVVVGSNVEYAEKVHNGMWTSEKGGQNRKYKERPFLRVGIEKTKDQMKEQAEKIFKGQL